MLGQQLGEMERDLWFFTVMSLRPVTCFLDTAHVISEDRRRKETTTAARAGETEGRREEETCRGGEEEEGN